MYPAIGDGAPAGLADLYAGGINVDVVVVSVIAGDLGTKNDEAIALVALDTGVAVIKILTAQYLCAIP